MVKYLTTYSPKHRVVIKDLATGQVKFDVSNDLISLTTNKAYGRSAGTWQMMLTYETKTFNGDIGRYDLLIKINDVITIELDAGGGLGMQPVMLGLVDRVATARSGGPTPNRMIKISGRDMGKALTDCDIGWDINAAQITTAEKNISNLWGSYERRLALAAGTPGELCGQIASLFFRVNNTAANLISMVVTTTDNWKLWNPSWSVMKGLSAWDAMKQCSHACWNMLHGETISVGDHDRYYVTLEQMPFDSDGMINRAKERTHIIGDEEIIQDDLGVSDSERINLLCYWPKASKVLVGNMLDLSLGDTRLTKFDEESIRYNGYRPKIIQDEFVAPEKNPAKPDASSSAYISGSTEVKSYEEVANFLWGWYSDNHEQENGTIIAHGRPDIKSGDRLLIPTESGIVGEFMEYLIEQVSHQYTVWPQPTFQTTLQATRGHLVEDYETYAYDVPPAKVATIPPSAGKQIEVQPRPPAPAVTPKKEIVTPVVPPTPVYTPTATDPAEVTPPAAQKPIVIAEPKPQPYIAPKTYQEPPTTYDALVALLIEDIPKFKKIYSSMGNINNLWQKKHTVSTNSISAQKDFMALPTTALDGHDSKDKFCQMEYGKNYSELGLQTQIVDPRFINPEDRFDYKYQKGTPKWINLGTVTLENGTRYNGNLGSNGSGSNFGYYIYG